MFTNYFKIAYRKYLNVNKNENLESGKLAREAAMSEVF